MTVLEILLSELTACQKSLPSHCLQILASPYHPFSVVNGKQIEIQDKLQEKRRIYQSQTATENEPRRAGKVQKLLMQRNKTCFFLSDLLPCYLPGCFWPAWWMVEYVADISSSSLLEFVSQIFLSYPDKLRKQKLT